ncbi:type I-F CRISPR-associated endoribonuclease Cas6/Csy4 [Moraxella sp. ZJ142]|uniref:type I-F CRISPR-associated endoribonuclease Cas6/Csy4 n=1 Tax=Moraxella marmotae TaxID=3344520 RepID=UPI0035D4E3F8
MQAYQEITLIAQPEIEPHAIWQELYTHLHIAFVEQKDADDKVVYGVAFPQYRTVADKNLAVLGFKCRIFAPSQSDLQRLDLDKRLERLADYVHISSIRAVPSEIKGYACYHRAIPKMSLSQRIAHQARRHQASIDEVAAYFQDYPKKPTDDIAYPFIRIKSSSNGQYFPLFIAKTQLSEPAVGKFGTYGLSRTASVPEF